MWSPRRPPNPLQTQFVLDAMDETARHDDERWEQVMESLDLIFAWMTNLGRTQQQLRSQVELTTQAVDKLGKEQQILTQKVDSTAQTVAQMLLHHRASPEHSDGPPTSPVHPCQTIGEPSSARPPDRTHTETIGMHRNFLPKMPFPQFTGEQPRIWKDKCLNYFRIFEIP